MNHGGVCCFTAYLSIICIPTYVYTVSYVVVYIFSCSPQHVPKSSDQIVKKHPWPDGRTHYHHRRLYYIIIFNYRVWHKYPIINNNGCEGYCEPIAICSSSILYFFSYIADFILITYAPYSSLYM